MTDYGVSLDEDLEGDHQEGPMPRIHYIPYHRQLGIVDSHTVC